MSTRVNRLVEGLGETLDERLAPRGATLSDHILLCLRALANADRSVATLGEAEAALPQPRLRHAGDAAYDVLESARGLFGLASRLRALATAEHLSRAGAPLSDGLRMLARLDDEPIAVADAYLVIGQATRVLARVAGVAAAYDEDAGVPGLREALLVVAEEVTEHAVLPLVRVAAGIQGVADG